jgi:SAM-dependent methyltransferase
MEIYIEKEFTKMKSQLELVAKSYDKAIEFGKRGIDLYNDLPEYIINDPDYPMFQKARMEGLDSDSGRKEIRDYLSPNTNMRFIDLGCCVNLMFKGYDKWHSTYYGVDISSKTIQLLNEFAARKKIPIGSLYCGSLHETPFGANHFDIGACIGVLEYFERNFVADVMNEIHRIIKPYGKFVLDIPNIESPMRRIMMLIEEYMGRPDKFDLTSQEFEDMLQNYFEIEKTEKLDAVAMIQYFLRCKK